MTLLDVHRQLADGGELFVVGSLVNDPFNPGWIDVRVQTVDRFLLLRGAQSAQWYILREATTADLDDGYGPTARTWRFVCDRIATSMSKDGLHYFLKLINEPL